MKKTVWTLRKLVWRRGPWGLSVAVPQVAVMWPWKLRWRQGVRAKTMLGRRPTKILSYQWCFGPVRLSRQMPATREERRAALAGFEEVPITE